MERQIRYFLFARLLKSRDKDGVLELATKGQLIKTATDSLKDPYVLDFLGLGGLWIRHTNRLPPILLRNITPYFPVLGCRF